MSKLSKAKIHSLPNTAARHKEFMQVPESLRSLVKPSLCERMVEWAEDCGLLYATPQSLGFDEWEEWEREMKKKHPVQYWLRDKASSVKYRIKRAYSNCRYFIKYLFKPAHPIVRKALTREWQDICSLIESLNFAMILQFKQEADNSFVDWDGVPEHRKFKNWLDAAAKWVAVDRPNLEKMRDAAYPDRSDPAFKNKSYEELYGEVNRIEKLIEETDTNIMKQMIEYRGYFWT